MIEEKRKGYLFIDKRKFEPTLPMFCPKCERTTLHSDNRYLLNYEMCASCYFSYEMEMLSDKKISEDKVGKLKGIKINPGES